MQTNGLSPPTGPTHRPWGLGCLQVPEGVHLMGFVKCTLLQGGGGHGVFLRGPSLQPHKFLDLNIHLKSCERNSTTP